MHVSPAFAQGLWYIWREVGHAGVKLESCMFRLPLHRAYDTFSVKSVTQALNWSHACFACLCTGLMIHSAWSRLRRREIGVMHVSPTFAQGLWYVWREVGHAGVTLESCMFRLPLHRAYDTFGVKSITQAWNWSHACFACLCTGLMIHLAWSRSRRREIRVTQLLSAFAHGFWYNRREVGLPCYAHCIRNENDTGRAKSNQSGNLSGPQGSCDLST